MKINVWRGYHSPQLLELIENTWEKGDLLYVGSPTMGEIPSVDINKMPDKPVLAVLTSGTTSTPRFVYYSKKNIETSLDSIMELFDLKRVDGIFCYPQPFHTFGLTLGYVLAMLKGWQLKTPSGKYSQEAHSERCQIKSDRLITLGTPVHFRDLLSYVDQNKIHLSPTYSAIVGGASVSVDLWKALKFKLNIEAPSIGYGCTEASPGLTHLPPGQAPQTENEIGLPLKNVNIKILPGSGIEFSGPNVCLAFEQGDGLVYPEKVLICDHVEANHSHSWNFLGRHDLVINCGGQKISVEAVERSIFEEFGYEALCFSIPDDRLGEDLGIVIKSTDQIDEQKIIDLVLSRFEKRVRSSYVFVTDAFALNVNGKVNRKAFPTKVSKFENLIPHRNPMIWVDEVLSASSTGGVCRLKLKKDAHYMTNEKVRMSSFIEFVAQSFAFVRCAGSDVTPFKDAFLVATRNTKFFVQNDNLNLNPGCELHIKISGIKDMLPFSVCDGEVRTPKGELMMSTQLRVFQSTETQHVNTQNQS